MESTIYNSNSLYLWIKAAHIIGMVCWFAGLFYLPRLFVYHRTAADRVSCERFEVMELKLYRIIMNPSMLITLVFGIWALVHMWPVFGGALWLWLKVALVLLLIGYHHTCRRIMRSLAAGELSHSERFLRVFNEFPALILILVVVLATVKPFAGI